MRKRKEMSSMEVKDKFLKMMDGKEITLEEANALLQKPPSNLKAMETILQRLKETLEERSVTYNDSRVESHEQMADILNGLLAAYFHPSPLPKRLRAPQAAVMMACLKAQRAMVNPEHIDSYRDGAGYFLIAQEAQEKP
jgi:hypothetical protein